jgi:hypothetical protein
MDYNNGGFFGYDQIWVNPSCETYKDYDRKSISVVRATDRLANGGGQQSRETFADPGYDRLANHGGQHVRGRGSTEHFCNSIQDYLNQAAGKETELNKIKKKLSKYKHRHDMMFIFITCLFIIIIIQYAAHVNTVSSLQRHMHPIYIAAPPPAVAN